MTRTTMEYLQLAAKVINEKKGINILALDVKGLSSITDYLLIAEGNIDRHVIAIAKELIESLKKQGLSSLRIEGIETGDWIIIDYPGFMIHLLVPAFREKYQLERLWPESTLVELSM